MEIDEKEYDVLIKKSKILDIIQEQEILQQKINELQVEKMKLLQQIQDWGRQSWWEKLKSQDSSIIENL